MAKEKIKCNQSEKDVKRAFRIARLRLLKNLLIWMSGVLTSVFLLVAVVFIGGKVIPISTYVGDENVDQYFSKEIASKSVFDAINSIDQFGVSDLPILEKALRDLEATPIGETGTLADIIQIDYQKLKTLKFGSETFSEELTSCIKVVATIESVGGTQILGDFNIEAFKTFEKVTEKPQIQDGYITKGEDGEFTSNPKHYYYKVEENGAAPMSEQSGEQPIIDTAKYERAFSDDGKLLVDADMDLYYVPLFKAPILDMLDLIDEIFGRVKVMDLLTMAGVEFTEGEEDNLIESLFEGKTVSELGGIVTDDIYLYDILKGDKDSDLYNILKEATGKETVEEITLSMLTDGLEINNISMTTVLPYKEWDEATQTTKDNSELYKILLSAIKEDGVSKLPEREVGEEDDAYDSRVEAAAKALSVSDLSSIEANDMLLSSIMSTPGQDVKDILQSATGKNYNEITVGMLSSLNTDNISLSVVLTPPSAEDNPDTTEDEREINKKLYDILLQALTITDADDQVITNPTYSDIKLSHLGKFNPDNIKLNTVMPKSADNAKLYDILKDLTNGKDYTVVSLVDLKTFNTDNIKLNTVMPKSADNAKLYDILKDVTGKDYTEVTLVHLKTFNTDNLQLATVLNEVDVGGYGNAIIDKLVEKGAKVGSIGQDINNLTLYEVYGEECFKAYGTEGVTFVSNDTWFAKEWIDTDTDGMADHWAFVHREQSYFDEHPEVTKYGLCADDGIWLLLCFDGVQLEDTNGDNPLTTDVVETSYDTDGRPEKYVISDRKISDLENANVFSTLFEEATVRQLVDAGLLSAPQSWASDDLRYLISLQAVLG